VDIKDFHRIYFVGIGGIGMSAIARWFYAAGYQVAGYDKTPSDITNSLSDEGITVSYTDVLDEIPAMYKNEPETTLVVYTPAIPSSHKGLMHFKSNKYVVLKRSEALGLLVKQNKGIAIAGTHGKTSISTTVAWLLNEQCSAFLGGISKNLNSNVIINPDANHVVIEADEFDRSFLTLFPEIAVVSSMDADHLDIYNNHGAMIETFHTFISQIKPEGSLIYKLGLEINKDCNTRIKYYTYSLDNSSADFYADNLKINNGFYSFNWHTPNDIITDLHLGVPGLYNLENAVAAMACAWLAGANSQTISQNLQKYIGVKRRFDYQIRNEAIVYIDDYAHHPEEIKACINSVRHLYPQQKILGVFQPHLYSRTHDFSDGFAESLDLCDQVILTDIYPAREEPMPGVDSRLISNKMKNKQKTLCAYSEVVGEVMRSDAEIIITMGAGDIDRLVPNIKEGLIKKYKL
jgi:UDP-N-acetylmuramate--alanine ligase